MANVCGTYGRDGRTQTGSEVSKYATVHTQPCVSLSALHYHMSLTIRGMTYRPLLLTTALSPPLHREACIVHVGFWGTRAS